MFNGGNRKRCYPALSEPQQHDYMLSSVDANVPKASNTNTLNVFHINRESCEQFLHETSSGDCSVSFSAERLIEGRKNTDLSMDASTNQLNTELHLTELEPFSKMPPESNTNESKNVRHSPSQLSSLPQLQALKDNFEKEWDRKFGESEMGLVPPADEITGAIGSVQQPFWSKVVPMWSLLIADHSHKSQSIIPIHSSQNHFLHLCSLALAHRFLHSSDMMERKYLQHHPKTSFDEYTEIHKLLPLTMFKPIQEKKDGSNPIKCIPHTGI